MAHFIVTYDIACPKRLRKVAKFMEQVGIRLQYSVFYVQGGQDDIAHVIDTLSVLTGKDDDVRIYRAPPLEQIEWLGRTYLGEDVWYKS